MWRSLVARVVRDDEAAGSNPVTPTNSMMFNFQINDTFQGPHEEVFRRLAGGFLIFVDAARSGLVARRAEVGDGFGRVSLILPFLF